jgi:uncharacterized SAM-binding protein YcdF (DUF218 family)
MPSKKPAPATPALIPVPPGFWFHRRELRWPTWRLWLCGLLTVAALLILTVRHLHRWLAVTDRVPDAKYLIVEGWVPDDILVQTIAIADDADADRIFCTGVPLEHGSHLSQYKTYAEVAANSLAKLGVDPKLICPVPCPDVKTERTRTMANSLKTILANEPVPSTGRKINLITEGTHARRSRAIFQEVLGPEWQVGVISIPDPSYDPDIWYRQSGGVRSVISEVSAISLKAVGGN